MEEKKLPINDVKNLYDQALYILFKIKEKYPQYNINGTKNI